MCFVRFSEKIRFFFHSNIKPVDFEWCTNIPSMQKFIKTWLLTKREEKKLEKK
jgi:hypothetical protein